MPFSSGKVLPTVEEEEATGEIADIYEAVKRELQMPFVPNFLKALAASPAALQIQWGMMQAFYRHTTLPQSLIAMISFIIAERSDCGYCSANHELTCRTLGVDVETLQLLVQDTGSVQPERIQAIIEFAVKVAQNPKALTLSDYDRVREQGVTDEEIVEVIVVAAIAVYSDTLADALKVEVETPVAEALGR